jgi:hypothetical protein
MKIGKVSAALAAFAIGICQMYLLLFCWMYIQLYSPVLPWLIGHGVVGVGLRLLLFVTDSILSIVLSIPAAALLLWLRPRNLWLHLPLAVLPSFLWQNRLLLSGISAPIGFAKFLPGILSELFVLPVAVFVLLRISAPVSPNKSFKPNPLRGSA